MIAIRSFICRLGLVLVVCVAARASALAQERKLAQTSRPPVDAALAEPGLMKLRETIQEAARQRNLEMLGPALGPEVNLDFEVYSTEALLKRLRSWPAEFLAEFWRDVLDALELPMARDDEYVYAPYVARTPLNIGDFTITARTVAVREAPDTGARVIEVLTYGIVDEASDPSWDNRRPAQIDGASYGWRRVVTPLGKTGWVSAKYARSPIDARLLFKQVQGQWKLVGIVRGD